MATRGRRQGGAPGPPALGAEWAGDAQELLLGMGGWRALHPKAPLVEIEAELDRRLHRLRALMLTDLALASTATDPAAGERPVCPVCGGPLHDAGRRDRTVVTQGNQPVRLRRDYATCARCGSGLFPPGR
jgi:hypothetical protein